MEIQVPLISRISNVALLCGSCSYLWSFVISSNGELYCPFENMKVNFFNQILEVNLNIYLQEFDCIFVHFKEK